MRLPIGYALAYPDRLHHPFGAIDWTMLTRLDFEQPDRDVFVCLDLAEQAGRAGGLAPAWLNAANEVAVAAFLAGRMGWGAIADVVADTVDSCEQTPVSNAEDVIEADRRARARAELSVQRRGLAA
jgi:1-deoxy-D-xylulose-5-phosphate reductoisomerase